MIGTTEGTCTSTVELVVDALLIVSCLVLAVASGILARRRFVSGLIWRGWVMIICAVLSGATSALWGLTTFLGLPPFFMAQTRPPWCDTGQLVRPTIELPARDESAGKPANPLGDMTSRDGSVMPSIV